MSYDKKVQPLVIKNLTKHYGDQRGIENISLDLNAGEVFGFLGPNGAGKSTTIRTVLGFITQSQGSVSLFGESSVQSLYDNHNNIGYLAGDIALYDTMTGRALLKFLTKLGRQTDWKYVQTLEERFKAQLDRKIKTLSKGNKQKVGLIQAFMHKPDLLILDEPTSGLDPLMKQVFYDEVRASTARGAAVFISSHDLNEVQKICNKAAFIKDGHLVSIEDITQATKFTAHRYTVECRKDIDKSELSKLEGVRDITVKEKTLTVTVSGSVDEFIRVLTNFHPIELREQELELEEIFMHYYKDKEDVA